MKWTSDNSTESVVYTFAERGLGGNVDDKDDNDDNDDNDQPSAGQEEQAEARVYILDLGGWKSEIAPYWAVRHGGAL
ncbi:hypothetical protein P5V15_008884 [Pogonomyrmex californicus]